MTPILIGSAAVVGRTPAAIMAIAAAKAVVLQRPGACENVLIRRSSLYERALRAGLCYCSLFQTSTSQKADNSARPIQSGVADRSNFGRGSAAFFRAERTPSARHPKKHGREWLGLFPPSLGRWQPPGLVPSALSYRPARRWPLRRAKAYATP